MSLKENPGQLTEEQLAALKDQSARQEEQDLLSRLDAAIEKHVAQSANEKPDQEAEEEIVTGTGRDAMKAISTQRSGNEITSEHQEYHNGLPVLSVTEFKRLYNTDIRALGQAGAATFNFQGYIKHYSEGHAEYVYADRIATNGILKDDKQNGIHMGFDGVTEYDDIFGSRMEKPTDVGEYVVFIGIPYELQRRNSIIASSDQMMTFEAYDQRFGNGAAERYINKRESDGEKPEYIVIRLRQKPQKDSEAREKVLFLHSQAIRFLESGKNMKDLEKFISDLDRMLVTRHVPKSGNLLDI